MSNESIVMISERLSCHSEPVEEYAADQMVGVPFDRLRVTVAMCHGELVEP